MKYFRLLLGRLFDKMFSSSKVLGQLVCIVLSCVIGIVVLYWLGGCHWFDADGFISRMFNALDIDGVRFKRVVELMLDTNVFGNGQDGGMSNAWQLIITLFGTVVFLAMIINAFGNVVDNRIEDYKKGFVRYWFSNHVIFLGANEVIIGMIDHLATIGKFRKKKFVVLTSADCESVRDNITSHLSENARKLKITFLFGERNNDDTLKSIYVDKASHIYVVGEDEEHERDSINVECWNHIKTIRKGSDKVAKCYLVLDRQSSVWVFNKMKADPASGVETNVIDTLESLSQRVLVNPQPEGDRKAPPTLDGPEGIGYDSDKIVHLIVLGMTQMASSMAMTAAHLCHFPNYLRDRTKKTLITFIAPDAQQEMAFLKGRYTHLFRLSECEYLEEGQTDAERKADHYIPEKDFLDVRWQFVKGSIEQAWVRELLLESYGEHKAGRERLTIAVCGNDAEKNIASALYLPEQFYAKTQESGCDDVAVLVYQPISGERIYTACSRTYRYSNLYPFGQYDRSYDPSYRARLLAAKKINYLYANAMNYEGMPEKYAELDGLWQKSSFLDRASSMYSANSIYMKLRSVGLNPGSSKKELQKHVEMLSEVEHNRWDIERLILGVSDVTEEQIAEFASDPAKFKRHWKENLHLNKNLVPYQELDEPAKDFDRIIVSNMLDVIN